MRVLLIGLALVVGVLVVSSLLLSPLGMRVAARATPTA